MLDGKYQAAYLNLDYAGPLYVKNIFNIDSNDVYKVWRVIIMCASSCEIVLEYWNDLLAIKANYFRK